MKHIFSLSLLLILVSTLLADCSCRRKCTSVVAEVKLVNFDSASLNAVVVKQYNNNGQFTDLQRTTVYTSMVFTAAHIPGPDTVHLDTNGIILEYFTDYIVTVPAAGKEWHLKNVSMVPDYGKTECTNGVTYYQNDTLRTIPSVNYKASAAVIYLYK